MIKTNDLNEYVMLSMLKNICEVTINDSDCSECKINAVCDYGLGSKPMKKIDIKYESDDKNNINDITVTYSNINAEEKQ